MPDDAHDPSASIHCSPNGSPNSRRTKHSRECDTLCGFTTVFEAERAEICNSRGERNISADKLDGSLTGLAFSGGGIRSATFNLGVLQALAKHQLLHKFDY